MLCSSRFLGCALALAGFGATLPVKAQTTDTSSSTTVENAYFQSAAAIVGGLNSITITRVPVSAGGKTYYWDLTVPFLVDADGTLVAKAVEETPSVIFVSSAFKAGTYGSPSTVLSGQGKIVLAGPGVYGSYSQWTISAASGANNCTYPESGAFYVAPLVAENPIYSRLKKANITSNAWYYGTGTSNCYATWPSNGIIGVSQVGNTLTIASFSYNSYGSLVDQNTPVDQITYTLSK